MGIEQLMNFDWLMIAGLFAGVSMVGWLVIAAVLRYLCTIDDRDE